MMKRLVSILALALFVTFLTPSVALAQEEPAEGPTKQGVFGEVTMVDPVKGEIILQTKGGEEVSISIEDASVMLHGHDIAMAISRSDNEWVLWGR